MTPENAGEKQEIRDEKGRFVPGVSGNPAGKPPGTISIMSKIKKKFEEDPELFESYVAEVLTDPKLRQEIIRQLDGAPQQKMDVTSDGERIMFLSPEIADKNNIDRDTGTGDVDTR